MSTNSNRDPDCRTILGVRFFQGTETEAVQRSLAGGLVLCPAAPALLGLTTSAVYRDALLDADMVLADSAFMVLAWNLLERDRIARLSGLRYLRALLLDPSFRAPGRTLWVMSGEQTAARNVAWLSGQGIELRPSHTYIAPLYDVGNAEGPADPTLLVLIERLRPQHIVLTLGGGTQEPLGLFLKLNLSYRPAIHCIGAAIAFLSGEQVRIPDWADRFYLGWLLRTVASPRRFARRYWEGRKLFTLLRCCRDRLPPLAPNPVKPPEAL